MEVSVVTTYVQLCAEDHRWWWRSFERGGALALYFLIYSVGFFANTLHSLTGILPVVLFATYTGLIVFCLYLACGAIGFISSFWFVHAIFSSARLE